MAYKSTKDEKPTEDNREALNNLERSPGKFDRSYGFLSLDDKVGDSGLRELFKNDSSNEVRESESSTKGKGNMKVREDSKKTMMNTFYLKISKS